MEAANIPDQSTILLMSEIKSSVGDVVQTRFPIFIKACKYGVEGDAIYITINNIVSFEKHKKYYNNEQWYVILTTNGTTYYTNYNMMSLVSV